ncbi:MAG: DUF3313 family protein [Panacagrimonas sp.]
MRRRRAVLALAALALAACAPAPRAPLASLGELDGNDIVLVGKVELVPPLRKGEQRIRGAVVGKMENTIHLMMDDKLRPMPQDPRIADFAGRIEAKIGETFFVRGKAAPSYVLGGLLFLDIGGSSQQKAYFPGGFQVAAKPGDRAVYVGTLRYHRDEFFEIQRITVVDEYREASAEFKITDAQTGELLGAGVDRRAGGKTLKKGFSSWADVEGAFQYWAERLRYRLCKERGGADCVAPET